MGPHELGQEIKITGHWSNSIQWMTMPRDWRSLDSTLSNAQFSSKPTSEYIIIRGASIQTILIMEFLVEAPQTGHERW